MAPHSSTLAWKIPWMEEPGGLLSMGSYRVGHNFTFTLMHWRRKWQPTPVFLPGKSHGWRSLAGYGPWGHKESDTTERVHFHPFRKLMAPRPRLVGPIVTWVNLKHHCRDFPSSPVAKNLPANAGDAGSIPGPGTKIPQALEQLSLHSTKKIPYNATKT